MHTLGKEEGKELTAQLSVRHGLPQESVLLSQLLGGEVFHLACNSLVVVHQGDEGSIGRLGK